MAEAKEIQQKFSLERQKHFTFTQLKVVKLQEETVKQHVLPLVPFLIGLPCLVHFSQKSKQDQPLEGALTRPLGKRKIETQQEYACYPSSQHVTSCHHSGKKK